MLDNTNIGGLLNALIPISRFNKGEANKIFDEVNHDGYKIVVKNNIPACVLVSPQAYQDMLETIENYSLLIEAEKRMKNSNEGDFLTEDSVLADLGITKEELDSTEVEIDE